MREPTVSRRGLFGWIAVAPVAATVVANEVAAAPTVERARGFGEIALKEAGAVARYDSNSYGMGYAITDSYKPDPFWPGLKDWFGNNFDESEYEGTFDG